MRLQLRGQERLLAEDAISQVSFLSDFIFLLPMVFLLSSQLVSQFPWLGLDSFFLWT